MFGKLVKFWFKFSLLLVARQEFLTWPEVGVGRLLSVCALRNVNQQLWFLGFRTFYPSHRAPGVPKKLTVILTALSSFSLLWSPLPTPVTP